MANLRNKTGYVYIASSESHPDIIKIGCTQKNPIERVRDLNYSKYFSINDYRLTAWFKSDTAFEDEKKIKYNLSDYSVKGEFYHLSADDVVNRFKGIFDFTFSEFYDENFYGTRLITLRLRRSLLEEIDERCAIENISRNAFITRIIEQALEEANSNLA